MNAMTEWAFLEILFAYFPGLKKKGAEKQKIVAMLVDRNIFMLEAIFACLKSGCIYLPIDFENPEDRIFDILEDSEAVLLITTKEIKNKIQQSFWEKTGKILEIIVKETIDAEVSAAPADNPELSLSADSLAYIMYTSGSTGKPKGTLISHYNISRVVKNTNYIDISQDDKFLQLSTYAFDGSTFDIFGALLNGAALELIDKEDILDVQKLTAKIRDCRITVMFITTALFNTLIDFDPACFSGIRKVCFGGERVSVDHVKKAFEYLGKGKIIHVYGPTESTVYATYYPIDKIDDRFNTIPIGRALANTKLYVLGQNDELLPHGVAGELCIAGDGLSRGYLHQPELTADKFCANPLDENEIIYRTGDLVRWLNSGDIEFIDRIDQQVKIRGFRIEMGEIESALLKHPDVEQAFVTVIENQGKEKILCAYYVPVDQNSDPGPRELKDFLQDFLPAYMIPAFFLRLDSLPLNINKKVNKRALPLPEMSALSNITYVAPANEWEEKLQAVWCELFDLEKISVEADFFDIGGHSIKTAILVSKIQAEFKIDIPFATVFKHPTIRKLALLLETADKDRDSNEDEIQKEDNPLTEEQKNFIKDNVDNLNKLNAEPLALLNQKKDKNIFAFPPISGYGFVFKGLADHLKNHSFYAFDFIGKDNIISKYTDMVLSVQEKGPYILFGYSLGGNVAFEVAKELELRGHDVSDIIVLDSNVKRIRYDENEKEVQKTVNFVINEELDKVLSVVNEAYQVDLKNTPLHERLTKMMHGYFTFGLDLTNSGNVNADVHIILSTDQGSWENQKTEEEINIWKESTSGQVTVNNGIGEHDKMIDPENVEGNAGIIGKILAG